MENKEKEVELFLCHQLGTTKELEYIFKHAICDIRSYPCSGCPHRVECEFRTKTN